ncbi:tetratricopeptide (TPR) repeat protein [Bosea sp. BE125]|uniref:tetratricopeptide repeat protein n=1 Tax=Bosea sp. BE125 TaxID=2817909 RepID=UPI00285C7E8B|nr:tetratricopeptide repeat protein [Bosea sp. BE125]MDR6871021.1 tetratricopeptide (TPR) repeat protein [Bosea sp. BE125]
MPLPPSSLISALAALLFIGLALVIQPGFDRAWAQTPASPADETLCHKTTGQPAIDACTKLIASKRFSGHELAVLLNDRGLLFLRSGEAQRAIADYDEALAADPGLGTALYDRGLALTQLGRIDQAILDFGRAGTLVPDRAAIWQSRGVAYFLKADFTRAIEDLDRAISLDAKAATAWAYRGAAHARSDNLKQGASDLAEAVRLAPGNATFAALLKEAEEALRQKP